MKYADAVRHLEEMGLSPGPVNRQPVPEPDTLPQRARVPVVVAKNGAISKKLQRMIRQSRAEARKSL